MSEPFSEANLRDLIDIGEAWMRPTDLAFWQQVRIRPQKWSCSPMGDSGGGFWVVAVWGQWCVWFNDVEGGFNVSDFEEFGVISRYSCGQEDLHSCMAGCNFARKVCEAV